jgi:hypothetical protein
MEKEDLAAFFGLYFFRGVRVSKPNKRLILLSFRPWDIEFMRSKLAALPFHFNETGPEWQPQWYTMHKGLYDLLLSGVHADMRKRRIPKWLKNADESVLRSFFENLPPNNPNYPGSYYPYKRLAAEDLDFVFHRLGLQSYITRGHIRGRNKKDIRTVYNVKILGGKK